MSWLDDIFNALGGAGSDIWSTMFGGSSQNGWAQPGWQAALQQMQTTPFGQGGGLFGALGGALNSQYPMQGLFGLGELLGTGYESMNQANRLNQIAKMAQNPAYYQRFIQPLSQQFTAAIEGPVKSEAAQMGLATSPGMMTTLLANALAPYQLQEQQMGINEAQQGLDYSALAALSDPYQQFLQSLRG